MSHPIDITCLSEEELRDLNQRIVEQLRSIHQQRKEPENESGERPGG